MADRRELILDLLARDKSGPATKSFGKNLDDAGKAADRAAKGVGKLDGEISKVEAELVKLGHAFADTNDKADRLDLSKKIRAAQNDLRRLNTSKGLISSILPDPSPGEVSKWTTKLKASISQGLASVGPLAGGAAVLGAALAPTLGAAIAGAVVGGVGAGGVLGGVALVARDPQVQAHAIDIGTRFAKAVNVSAKDAFLLPVQKSLSDIEGLAARTAPRVGKIFQATAPGVDVLTTSLVHAGDALGESLVGAAEKSGPVMKVLGDIIEGTGESLGEFIDMAADHADEGASALTDLNTALQNTITVTTAVVGALATVKGGLDSVDDTIDKGRYWWEDHAKKLDITADGYHKGTEAAELYRKGIIGAAGSANDYEHYLAAATEKTDALAASHENAASAADKERTALVDLSNELKAQTDPVFGLLNAQDKLAKAHENVAKATEDHGAKSEEAKKALRDLASAAIDLEGKAGALGGTFDGELTPQLRATLRAAGLTKGEIDRLGDQFRDARRDGDRFAKNYKANVSVSGTATAAAQTRNVRDLLNQLHSRKINVSVVVAAGQLNKVNNQLDRIGARASGGPITRNVPYLVGENGPELVVPDANARVLSAPATKNLTQSGTGNRSGAGSGGGSGTLRLELVGQRELVTMFRYLVRTANLLQDA